MKKKDLIKNIKYRNKWRCVNCGGNYWNFMNYLINNRKQTVSLFHCVRCNTMTFKKHDIPIKKIIKKLKGGNE